MPDLSFIQAEHRYILSDGDVDRELPSVTAVLKAEKLIDDTWFTEQARIRGDFVHIACHLLDDDELDTATVDPVVLPYLTAYQRFLDITEPDWTYVEHRVYDQVLGYAGTLDRAGLVQGERLVIDIKTGSCPPSVGPQTAAYRRRLPEPHSWKRAALQLKADGTFKLHPLSERSDEQIFLSALAVYQWKQRHL